LGTLGRSWSATVRHWALRGLGVLLGVGGADPGRDDAPLGLARVRQGVAGEVHAAALPGGPQHLRHGGLQALMGIGDDQLHAAQPAALQAAQEVESRTARPPELPTAMPRTSRRPSALTPTAMVTATGTIRPASRTFT
jgi:hypothetical protein